LVNLVLNYDFSSMRKTGFTFHELYLWHDIGNAPGNFLAGLQVQPGDHFEHPETKRRFRNLLEVSGLLEKLVQIRPEAATVEQLQLVHSKDYIEKIRKMSDLSGGDAGEGAPFGKGSFEIALLATGGVIRLSKAVWNGEVDNGYALVRPPGHHAERDRGRGFCIFGNIAVAAKFLRYDCGVKRIAIVDWDVHHGNGTQDAFYDDPNVLTISIHQDGLFPRDSGYMGERGVKSGFGSNLNIPLPPGSGNGAYLTVFEEVVRPALEKFVPDFIFVASGYDASVNDPLGRMMVTSSGYRKMASILIDVADTFCNGRLVVAHEGGYSLSYVPYCGLAVIEELANKPTEILDPNLSKRDAIPGQDLQAHQAEIINKAVESIELIPNEA